MKLKVLMVIGVVVLSTLQVFASGRVLSTEEAGKIMPVACSYLKKAYERTRHQVDLSTCVKSKAFIKVQDPNYGTYIYGDFKVDSLNKVNCSIMVTDDLSAVKLADCSDE